MIPERMVKWTKEETLDNKRLPRKNTTNKGWKVGHQRHRKLEVENCSNLSVRRRRDCLPC